jgi:general secretion pathway protein G
MQKRVTKSVRKGFTLIELLLVLVILGVLAALVVPKFTNRSQQARETAAKTDISNIQMAIDAFEIDNGRYPASLDELMQGPPTMKNGPYLQKMPKDPWGNEYVYVSPGQRNTHGIDLYSLGPDGREGQDDIGNWD